MTDAPKVLVYGSIAFSPELGKAFGICGGLLIQQIHYWCTIKGHQRDGHAWVWNTTKEWTVKLGVFDERTIKNNLMRLRNMGVVIVGNFNKHKYDKTLWYRLDYDKIAEVLEKSSPMVKQIHHPSCISFTIHSDADAQPIPESTSETTAEKTIGPSGEKITGTKITMKVGKSAREVHNGLLENLKNNKAAKAGEPAPYKNSAQTLELTWKRIVPKLETGGGFIPSFTLAQRGMLGRLCKIWGVTSETILPCVLNNWIDYTKFVASQCGISKTPDAPKVEFLAKYANEAAAYSNMKSVQLIAPKPKSKIVVVKKQQPKPEAAPAQEEQAGVADIMMYLK